MTILVTAVQGSRPSKLVMRVRFPSPASFRPKIDLLGKTTRVLVEQVGAIDASRLGELVGRVSPEQQWGIDEALLTVLGLR